MNRTLIALAVVVFSASGLCAAGQTEIVKLTIEEEAGFARVNEPVTMGVPLPEGKVDDAGKLALLDEAGKEVPCQFAEVARWLDGKTVKWVHATWSQSLTAKGKTTVTVALRDKAEPQAKTALSAELKDNIATVQTGCVKFVVRGAKFNSLDAAWFDPSGANKFDDANKVIEAGKDGGSTVLSPDTASVKAEDLKFKVEGQPKTYSSTNDADGKVVIEEQGPRRVVVKATGRHLDASGNKALDYIVRYYAYADSPIVRVSHAFVGAHGTKPTDVVFLSGLSLHVPTKLAGGKAVFGTEADPVQITSGLPARIVQDTSDSFTILGADSSARADAQGKGKSTKPLTTGWLDLSKDKLGLAVGVRWFWQMFPKALRAGTDGAIDIGLYPADTAEPLEVYMGQSRTHYMTLVFHDDKTTAKDLNAIFAGQNRPLRAWAPPRYYCRDTHCFGYSAESDPALFGDKFDSVKKHDEVLLQTIKDGVAKLDGRNRNGQTHESYGIYAWGDMYHWNWPDWGKSPYQVARWKLSWEGNYYDYPNVMLMQFVRSGEKLYLERFFPNAIQVGDVHTANYHARPELVGGCRYCPPRNFVAQDEGNVYVSPEYNHYKSQCVYGHYYLTGDLRSLDHCRMLANNAFANHDADRGWAARGVGAQLAGLWNAYELTRDPKYLARMKDMAGRAMAQFKSGKYSSGGDFMWGIANEGLCYYYWVTGDPAVIETFKEGYPKCKAATGYANMALGAAMTWRVTGDEQFREMAWKALTREKPAIGAHEVGQVFRSTHFALFFLSEASKDWKPFKQDAPAPPVRAAGR